MERFWCKEFLTNQPLGTAPLRSKPPWRGVCKFPRHLSSPLVPVFPCYTFLAAYAAGAAVAKLAYAAGLKSAGDFPVVGSTPTSRTILNDLRTTRRKAREYLRPRRSRFTVDFQQIHFFSSSCFASGAVNSSILRSRTLRFQA
jgi:hypothetical protein